ncbi:FMN reductase [Oerskovia flava]|uniref:FMN reductase n=1 Tax=Oerskovia flava TaxID=2986422 RepID=UPI00223E9251|nr:FMN reductase [Oerskovia sp. JB1-3-2]
MTTTDRRIVALSAGLSTPSSTTLLADRLGKATVAELGALGLTATTETIELREHAHDIVNAMLTGFGSDALEAVIERVTTADGIIVTTPVFTTTYSGLFKSFVDILDKDSLVATPVLLGATGGTPRHSLALEYSMRPLFTYLRADVATTSVFAATEDWAQERDGANTGGGSLHERTARAGRELAEKVALHKNTGPVDPFATAPSFEQMLGS